MNYGDHVRNWHVESDERRTDLSDPNSRIIWNGINGATGRPLRLFQNTFDNPLPTNEVRSLELLSLFGRAFPLFLALTVEETDARNSRLPVLIEDPDDSPFRREILVRVQDGATQKAITNASVEIMVTEGGRQYRFGRHPGDRHGQILLDYPPGKFESIELRVNAGGYAPHLRRHANDEGIYPVEMRVLLTPMARSRPPSCRGNLDGESSLSKLSQAMVVHDRRRNHISFARNPWAMDGATHHHHHGG